MDIKGKINLILAYYKDRLTKVEQPPCQHIEAIQIEAKISVLEQLLYYIEEQKA